MNINLTEEQNKNLLAMVFLGNLMINSVREDKDRIKKYDELEQFLYQLAQESGPKEMVTLNAEKNKLVLNKPFLEQNGLQELSEEFVEEIFWSELTNRLAVRDAIKKYGEDKLEKMSWDEFVKKQQPFLDKYNSEFEEDGLENIKIK